MGKDRQEYGFFETVRREMRLRNYSHKTIKAYISGFRSFVSYFQPRHPRELIDFLLQDHEHELPGHEQKLLDSGIKKKNKHAILRNYRCSADIRSRNSNAHEMKQYLRRTGAKR